MCERKLKEADLEEGVERPKSCGFTFPRTVCKREITRDEAIHYVAQKRTELLTDFTSRYGRPFSATLVLRDNGRHGFEFPPRGKKAEGDAAPGADGAPAAKPARVRRRAAAKDADAAAAIAPATKRRPARKSAAKADRPAAKRPRARKSTPKPPASE